MTPDDAELIELILGESERLAYLVAKGHANFAADWEEQYKGERCLERIGDAAKELSPGLRAPHPEANLSGAVQQRDKIAHYWNINIERVWRSATESVPALTQALRGIAAADR